MKFSQRIGKNPAIKPVQIEEIDTELLNSLWSVTSLCYWDLFESIYDEVKSSNLNTLINSLWLNYFKKPVDTIPRYFEDCLPIIRNYFFRAEWYEVYDFIEFISKYKPTSRSEKFTDACNNYLEKENSGYRFVDGNIVEITSETEIASIEDAIMQSAKFGGVKKHLQTSLILISDRKNPDFRNSIKESISAVESLAKQVSSNKKATLGEVLKELEKVNKLHPALKNAFSSLYGYTNDAKGIRHALMEKSDLSKADAQFMLVVCSAFINYVIDTTK